MRQPIVKRNVRRYRSLRSRNEEARNAVVGAIGTVRDWNKVKPINDAMPNEGASLVVADCTTVDEERCWNCGTEIRDITCRYQNDEWMCKFSRWLVKYYREYSLYKRWRIFSFLNCAIGINRCSTWRIFSFHRRQQLLRRGEPFHKIKKLKKWFSARLIFEEHPAIIP